MNNQQFLFGSGGRKIVTLENGQSKNFSSFNDANSWSIGQKSAIKEVKDFEVPENNKNYTKEDIVESTKLANEHGLNLPYPEMD